jgi:hypothetical protein
MDKQTLLSYIAAERIRGVLDVDIKAELLAKGWEENLVNETLSGVSNTTSALPSIMELLRSSFDELWRNIWKSILIMVLPVVLIFLLGIVGGVGTVFMAMNPAMMLGAGILLALAFIFMCVVMYVATIMLIKEVELGWTLSYMEALRKSLPYILPLFGVAILASLAIIGGFALFIIPGIIASIWYGFAQIAVVIDGKKGMGALRHSAALVQGRLWKVFLYYLVAMIVVMIANFILGLIPIVGIFVGFLTTPFTLIFTVRFYQSLKVTSSPMSEGVRNLRIAQALITLGILTLIGVVLLIAYSSQF